MHQVAHAHLCSSLLKIKGIAESPKLPAQIKPIQKPELSEEERTALHNVTSGLCNRKQVKGVIEQAIMSTCITLRVPMPEKKGKVKGKDKEKNTRAQKEDQADDISMDDVQAYEEKAEPQKDKDKAKEPILLKRRGDEHEGDEELEDAGDSVSSEGEGFEGFSDSEAEERAFSRYEDLLGGSSDEDDSEDEPSEEDEYDEDLEDSRDKLIRRVSGADDDISVSSLEEAEESESSDAESLSPPPKKSKTKAAKAVPIKAGNSAFLPSLMGGYISGSESASDVDVAPSAKKNRRGQRARQAIWEKKYGEKAKHKLQQPKESRDQGWDMQRGAVDPDGGAAAKPWKKGIRNPFEKNAIHPERMRHIENGQMNQDQRQEYTKDRSSSSRNQDSRERKPAPMAQKPPSRPEPKRDDTGTLHPSWAAAKKAKEEGQKVAFQGRKVVFD